jgi:hypothetical protein
MRGSAVLPGECGEGDATIRPWITVECVLLKGYLLE